MSAHNIQYNYMLILLDMTGLEEEGCDESNSILHIFEEHLLSLLNPELGSY